MPLLSDALHRRGTRMVSICVPCRDMLHSGFAFDLARLIKACVELDIATDLRFDMGTVISNQRESLLRDAIASGSTHVLWLDSDMMFPPDTLQCLLRHDLPVVAGNYATRQAPHKTVAYRDVSDWSSYIVHGDDDPPLERAQAVGMGCMLVQLAAIGNLPRPLFQTRWQAESGDYLGEDFVFCELLRAHGIDIMIDMELSRRLIHLGTKAFGHGMVRSGLQ